MTPAELSELSASVNGLMARIGTEAAAFKSAHERLELKYNQLEALINRPGEGVRASLKSGLEGFETPGARFIKEADLDLFRKTGRLRCDLKHFWPAAERKTTIDSSALGYTVPGVLGVTQIDPNIIPLARRRLVVRALMRAKPIETAAIDWIKELAFTNMASPQNDGDVKAQSGDTFTVGSAKVMTLAHWVALSRQAMDDLPMLGEFINTVLLYGLSFIEEEELLFGDASGNHLNGLALQATPYAGTYDVAGDTKLDKLRRVICELEAANEACSAFVLNPVDAAAIDLIKTENGGANKGAYVIGDPLQAGGTLQVKTYWGKPTCVTNAIPAGSWLAGDFSMAVIGDRLAATVDLSTEYSDFFVRNLVAVRAEERLSLACLRPSAFRYGHF